MVIDAAVSQSWPCLVSFGWQSSLASGSTIITLGVLCVVTSQLSSSLGDYLPPQKKTRYGSWLHSISHILTVPSGNASATFPAPSSNNTSNAGGPVMYPRLLWTSRAPSSCSSITKHAPDSTSQTLRPHLLVPDIKIFPSGENENAETFLSGSSSVLMGSPLSIFQSMISRPEWVAIILLSGANVNEANFFSVSSRVRWSCPSRVLYIWMVVSLTWTARCVSSGEMPASCPSIVLSNVQVSISQIRTQCASGHTETSFLPPDEKRTCHISDGHTCP